MAKHFTKATNMPHPNPALNFEVLPRAGSTFGDSARPYFPIYGKPAPEVITPADTPQS